MVTDGISKSLKKFRVLTIHLLEYVASWIDIIQQRDSIFLIKMSSRFHLQSDYAPRGDQRQAIDKLVKSLDSGNKHQTLLGVTGSGKTFTMANVIAEIGKPTLVMSHNLSLIHI